MPDKKCLACGMPADPEARFCERCGGERFATPEPPPPPAQNVGGTIPGSPSRPDVGGTIPGSPSRGVRDDAAHTPIRGIRDDAAHTLDVPPVGLSPSGPDSGLGAADTIRLKSLAEALAEPVRETVLAEDGNSECADLRVHFDTGRLFMEGSNTPFRIRLESRGEKLDEVAVTARHDGQSGAPLVDKRVGALRPGSPRDLSVNYRPPAGAYGLTALDWSVSYRRGGRRYLYEAQCEYPVYCRNQSPQSVVNQVVVNFDRIELSGNASDLQIKDAVNFYEKLGQKEELTANDLVSLALKAPAVWELLVLYEERVDEVAPRVAPPPPPEAIRTRATLVFDGQLVHLLSAQRLLLGRNRELADVCTRRFDAHGKATWELNRCLSQAHCQLEVGPGGCRVLDGAAGKPSTCGTFVDGRRVAANGAAPLVGPGEVATLCLGDPGAGDAGSLELAMRVLGCDSLRCDECPLPSPCGDREGVACVILSRTDDVGEHYALVVRQAPLNRVHAGFGRLRIGFSHGAFCYQSPREAGWLTPGLEFVLRGGVARVEPFHQFGIEPAGGGA